MIIELKKVGKEFSLYKGNLEVLKNISFSVEEGEVLAIVGPSGCGKTTLLNIIGGLDHPTSGKVEKKVNKHETGYMFQSPLLLPWRTVMGNVVLGIEIQNKSDLRSKLDATRLLQKYGLLSFADYYPTALSGGMKQRVAFLRTVMIRPKILLLDEPFSSLDYELKLKLERDLHEFVSRNKTTVILVTHDIDGAIALADRVIVLSHRPGRVISSFPLSLPVKDPIARRAHKDFSLYFRKIWRELNNEN